MKKENAVEALKAAISQLEQKRNAQEATIKQTFERTLQSLKPVNLIKKALKDIGESQDIKENLLKTTMGLALGMFSKKILIGSSKNIFRKVIGIAVELGVADLVIKNVDNIKFLGQTAIKTIFNKYNKKADA